MSTSISSASNVKNIPESIERQFHCTIADKRVLETSKDVKRMLLVSEDAQMFFLVTGVSVLALKFSDISRFDIVQAEYNAGKTTKSDTGLNWGLTALGAMAGWFVVSASTKTKVVDNIVTVNIARFTLNRINYSCSYYLCVKPEESILIKIALRDWYKKYNKSGRTIEGFSEESVAGSLIPVILCLTALIGAPILGLCFRDWGWFLGLIFVAFVSFLFFLMSAPGDSSKSVPGGLKVDIDDVLADYGTQTILEDNPKPQEKPSASLSVQSTSSNEAPKPTTPSERDTEEDKAKRFQDLNNKGFQYEREGEIEKAVASYEEAIKLGIKDNCPYDRLLVIYKKQKRTEDEIRIARLASEMFPDEINYVHRLCKLEGREIEVVLPTMAIVSHPKVKYGDDFEALIKEMPEFDFYAKGYNNSEYYSKYWSDENLAPYHKIHDHFKELEDAAQLEEKYNNFAKAAVIYEQIVAEKYWNPAPYDRLIKIYSKAKLKKEEKRVLELSINHFSNLKKTRLEYIMMLAKKYNAVEFAQERIDNDKKITYYMGAFDLYNPYTILEKWEERHKKLIAKEA